MIGKKQIKYTEEEVRRLVGKYGWWLTRPKRKGTFIEWWDEHKKKSDEDTTIMDQ